MGLSYADVRDWVLALPGGEEVMVPEWGHPTLRVNKKMFAAGAPDSPTISVKASKEEQAELIATAPETYAVAPYTGRYGWVTVTLATAHPEELRDLVIEAWRRTAPKKLVKEYDTGT
jgi:hypothetical protein